MVPTISPVPVTAFPTAKHTVVLVHVTAFSAWLSSLGGVWAVQVEPPFVVTISVATLLLPPTAKHTVALGQLTSFSAVFVAGAVSEFQVDPPLVVEMIVGAYELGQQ